MLCYFCTCTLQVTSGCVIDNTWSSLIYRYLKLLIAVSMIVIVIGVSLKCAWNQASFQTCMKLSKFFGPTTGPASSSIWFHASLETCMNLSKFGNLHEIKQVQKLLKIEQGLNFAWISVSCYFVLSLPQAACKLHCDQNCHHLSWMMIMLPLHLGLHLWMRLWPLQVARDIQNSNQCVRVYLD